MLAKPQILPPKRRIIFESVRYFFIAAWLRVCVFSA